MLVKDFIKMLSFAEIYIYEYGAFRGTFFLSKMQITPEYLDREIYSISASCDEVNVIEITLK